MARFRNTLFFPPGGRWFYTDPVTGTFFESAQSLAQVERAVADFLDVSGQKVPLNLRELIEAHMCERLPPGYCDGPGAPASRRTPTYFEVVEKVDKYFSAPAVLVTPGVAERRGLVCRTCPMNDLAICMGCNDLRAKVRRHLRGHEVSVAGMLGVCRVTRLPAFGLVWTTRKPALEDALPESSCWLKEQDDHGR